LKEEGFLRINQSFSKKYCSGGGGLKRNEGKRQKNFRKFGGGVNRKKN